MDLSNYVNCSCYCKVIYLTCCIVYEAPAQVLSFCEIVIGLGNGRDIAPAKC